MFFFKEKRKPIKTKFVLLSTARSGTTALITSIGNHPDAFCHREAFLRDSSLRSEFVEAHDMDQLRRDPIEFVRKIYAFSNGETCVGFKMWLNQCTEAAEWLMANEEIKKIILDRHNRLASYSSGLIRQITGVANAGSDVQLQEIRKATPKLDFDSEHFKNFVQNRDATHARYKQASKGDVLELGYNDVNAEVFPRVFDFLSLSNHEVEIRQKKINSVDILSRFDEAVHEDVIACLQELGHPEWVREE